MAAVRGERVPVDAVRDRYASLGLPCRHAHRIRLAAGFKQELVGRSSDRAAGPGTMAQSG